MKFKIRTIKRDLFGREKEIRSPVEKEFANERELEIAVINYYHNDPDKKIALTEKAKTHNKYSLNDKVYLKWEAID